MSEHDVFISYARSTEATARKLAEALRAEGFSVWRDDDLPPHRAYAEVIEERLRDASAVVVLWSVDAARSQWVRAEADIARNGGRLVQLRIDDVEPPIPFNQIQCLDFTRWRGGRTAPAWRKLVESISSLQEAQAVGPAAPGPPDSHAPMPRLKPLWRDIRVLACGALALVLVTIAAAWLMLRAPRGPGEAPTVQVAEFSAPTELKTGAAELAGSLATILSGAGVKIAKGPQAASVEGPLFRVEGDLRRDGGAYAVETRLFDVKNGLLLWSAHFDKENVGADNFFRQVGEAYAAMLHCALDDRRYARSPISPEAFGLYLNSCNAVMTGQYSHMLALTRRLVQAAPDFAAAYAMQGIAAGHSAWGEEHTAQERDALLAEGRKAVEKALALNPAVPKTWLASAVLRGRRGDWLGREHDLKMAMKLDPNLPPPRGMYAQVLRQTGRLREAAEFTLATAAAQDPRAGIGGYAEAAQYWWEAGDDAKATEALQHIEAVLPGEATHVRWTMALFSSDPRGPLAVLKASSRNVSPDAESCAETWLAGLDAAIASGRKGLPDACARIPIDRRIRMLARQGDVDGALSALEPYLFAMQAPPTILFTPQLRSVRADPRFIPLVKRLGLSDYWSKSGNWPDFCQAADRPYDCRRLV